jgi:WD40 repeat protein
MLHIIDANSTKILRSLQLPHEKNLTSIIIPQPSPHLSSLTRDDYQLFMTMANDNQLITWDLRQERSILQYHQHQHRREIHIHAAFSPCLKYFGIGSEDRTARIYDRIAGKESLIIQGMHKDCVTGVAFNPLFSQFATASYDGTVKFYCDPHYLSSLYASSSSS